MPATTLLPIVTVIRLHKAPQQVLGILSTIVNGQLFVAKTLELPDRNNASQVSCFPTGEYVCKYTMSPSFKKKTYEVTNVKGRAGIRIHSANFASQLRGCIALGSALKDINNDGLQDTVHSGVTMDEFEKLMSYKDFLLRVIEINISQ